MAVSRLISTKGWRALFMAMTMGISTAPSHAASPSVTRTDAQTTMNTEQTLSAKQQAIAPIGAFMAMGNVPSLTAALNQGLDAGLTVSEIKEIVVQLYAYAGFPRSFNALGELMKVQETRRQRGIQDARGREPSRPAPTGDTLLAAGTANQTKLSGTPVKGPLFEFAPAIDQFVKTHLFGDIFERDNLDWQSRELATVGMLSALQGAESQLQVHMGYSMNVGITASQLQRSIQVLTDRVDEETANRARHALSACLANSTSV
jgi:4-carboxymuconolactone decarboxylase